jgi:hypothetical protein
MLIVLLHMHMLSPSPSGVAQNIVHECSLSNLLHIFQKFILILWSLAYEYMGIYDKLQYESIKFPTDMCVGSTLYPGYPS